MAIKSYSFTILFIFC